MDPTTGMAKAEDGYAVVKQPVRNTLNRGCSRIARWLPSDMKLWLGGILPVFAIPRGYLGPHAKTCGTLYQFMLWLAGLEDRITFVDEPITAKLINSLRKDETFVDVGANAGVYTLMAAMKCGRVLAIEPGDKQFRALGKNVRLNRLGNVTCVKSAAWSERTKMFLHVNRRSHGWDSLLRSYPGGHEVNAERIDDIVERTEIDYIGLLKVDVEGAELEALEGAEKSLQKTRSVLVEIHENVDPYEVDNRLRNHGFETRLLVQHGSNFVVGTTRS